MRVGETGVCRHERRMSDDAMGARPRAGYARAPDKSRGSHRGSHAPFSKALPKRAGARLITYVRRDRSRMAETPLKGGTVHETLPREAGRARILGVTIGPINLATMEQSHAQGGG